MARSIKCPHCGGLGGEPISDAKYRCAYCGTVFVDEKEEALHHKNKDREDRQQHETEQIQQSFNYANKMRRTILFVTVFFILLGLGISLYMYNKTMDTVNRQLEKIPTMPPVNLPPAGNQ